MAPSRTVAARPRQADMIDGGGSDSDDLIITVLLPPTVVIHTHSMPGDAPTTTSSSASTPADLLSSSTPGPSAGTLSTMMYVVSTAPSADPPPPGQTDTDSDAADQKATRPLRTLAAVFGFLAIVFLLAILAIVARTRLKTRLRMKRARVRSVFWTRSRSDALAVVLAQPPSYATPGQELWAKQWAELGRTAETRRVPATPAMGMGTVTTVSARTLLAATLLARWSASMRSDVSPGSPPSYRSPSESSPRPTSRLVVQTPAVALTRSAAYVAPPPVARTSEETMS